MSPTGPSRLGSSIAVLSAPVQSEPVKGTFLLCSKGTFSYCCDISMPEPVEITINAISMEGLRASDPRVTINISEHSPLQRQLFRNAIDHYNGSVQLSVPAPDGFPVWRVDVAFSKYDAVSGFFFQPRG